MIYKDMPASWRRTFLTLWLGCFITGLGFSMTMPFMALYIESFGHYSRTQINFYSGLGYLFCSGRCFSLLGQSGRSKRTQADVSSCFRRDDVYRFFDRACNQRLHDYLFETFARSFFWLHQQLDGLYGR